MVLDTFVIKGSNALANKRPAAQISLLLLSMVPLWCPGMGCLSASVDVLVPSLRHPTSNSTITNKVQSLPGLGILANSAHPPADVACAAIIGRDPGLA